MSAVPFDCDIRACFARAFKAWRTRNRIPLKKIAADLGLSIATVNAWESKQRFPTGKHIEQLVNYTQLPPCRLFCLKADECVPQGCILALKSTHKRAASVPL